MVFMPQQVLFGKKTLSTNYTIPCVSAIEEGGLIYNYLRYILGKVVATTILPAHYPIFTSAIPLIVRYVISIP